MHIVTAPARNQASLNPGDDPSASLMSIVADITSLIFHVQGSARLIEAAMQRDIDAAGSDDAPDVVILDDVTPCYSTVSKALSACHVGLDAALQALLGTLSEAQKPSQRQAILAHKSA